MWDIYDRNMPLRSTADIYGGQLYIIDSNLWHDAWFWYQMIQILSIIHHWKLACKGMTPKKHLKL
jgi:hypothetical protein